MECQNHDPFTSLAAMQRDAAAKEEVGGKKSRSETRVSTPSPGLDSWDNAERMDAQVPSPVAWGTLYLMSC
jgi:hypothetical protein